MFDKRKSTGGYEILYLSMPVVKSCLICKQLLNRLREDNMGAYVARSLVSTSIGALILVSPVMVDKQSWLRMEK